MVDIRQASAADAECLGDLLWRFNTEFEAATDFAGVGLGTGSAILSEARRRVLDRGAPEMQINVDEPDTDARRFYERHGFVTVERGSEGRMLCYVGETRA